MVNISLRILCPEYSGPLLPAGTGRRWKSPHPHVRTEEVFTLWRLQQTLQTAFFSSTSFQLAVDFLPGMQQVFLRLRRISNVRYVRNEFIKPQRGGIIIERNKKYNPEPRRGGIIPSNCIPFGASNNSEKFTASKYQWREQYLFIKISWNRSPKRS